MGNGPSSVGWVTKSVAESSSEWSRQVTKGSNRIQVGEGLEARERRWLDSSRDRWVLWQRWYVGSSNESLYPEPRYQVWISQDQDKGKTDRKGNKKGFG